MSTLEFNYQNENGDSTKVVTKLSEDTTVYDITQAFVYFLRGMSFQDDTIKRVIKLKELDG